MRCEVEAEVKVRVEEQEREQEHGARRAAPMPYTLLARRLGDEALEAAHRALDDVERRAEREPHVVLEA